jgi:hypothetical protein
MMLDRAKQLDPTSEIVSAFLKKVCRRRQLHLYIAHSLSTQIEELDPSNPPDKMSPEPADAPPATESYQGDVGEKGQRKKARNT